MTEYKRILVTGGAGFIGSSFVAQAVKQGMQVIVLDALTYAGHRCNLEWIEATKAGSWQLVEGNICDGKLVGDLLVAHKLEAVVNFAAESHVDNSIARPAAFIDTNIMGTYTLLEASRHYWAMLPDDRKAQFRYLQISTDEVYGSLGPTGKFNEETPMRPNSPYSASKAAADHLARAWFHTYKLPTLVTNCTNNYGPRQYPEKLIPLMITRAIAGGQMPVYGDGQNVRDWIHVEDHCRGIALALEHGKPGETYCFGGDAERNNMEVVHTLCDTLDIIHPRRDGRSYRDQIAFVADRAGHDRRYAIDDTKARRELGFTRQYNFEEGLRATVEWYLANQDWCREMVRQAA